MTGVQTCALPISLGRLGADPPAPDRVSAQPRPAPPRPDTHPPRTARSCPARTDQTRTTRVHAQPAADARTGMEMWADFLVGGRAIQIAFDYKCCAYSIAKGLQRELGKYGCEQTG